MNIESISDLCRIFEALENGKSRFPSEVVVDRIGSSIHIAFSINLKHVLPVDKKKKSEIISSHSQS